MTQFVFQQEKFLDARTGVPQIISNIEVCERVASILSTTLGPYGLDKLFYGKNLLLTNDGATILENLNLTHPIERILTSLSHSQDKEVGDGTTSVILLTAEILANLKPLIKEDFNLDMIRNTLKIARQKCIEKLQNLTIDDEDALLKLVCTTLSSKNVRNYKQHFAEMLVKGLANDNLNIVKIQGGSIDDSIMVEGIAFEKTFTYAGYEQQPKKILTPKICFINIELEWKSERDNSEVRIESVNEYQNFVDAEWKIIKDKLDDIVNSGANVVLSSLPIGDYATQYFAEKKIFSAGRVKDLSTIATAFNGKLSNSTNNLKLGFCDLFEERQLGSARYNYFVGNSTHHTLILRGPGNEILEEVERAVHDAVCVVKVALKSKKFCYGGGATEMQLSKFCRDLSFSDESESVFIYKSISKAFERIPYQLATNFGLDAIFTLQNLRKAHSNGIGYGVGLNGVQDMRQAGIYEPIEVKINIIKGAFNAAEAILMIDSTLISKK